MKELFKASGYLSLGEHGEGYDILFCSGNDRPLAERLECVNGKNVKVHIWIEQPATEEKEHIEAEGKIKTEFYHRYSDITGYLWTVEEVKINKMDIIDLLGQHIGAFVEIVVSES